MEDEFDLYEDFITQKCTTNEEDSVTKAEADRWREEVNDSKEKLKRLLALNYQLKQENDQLKTNISSLIKTCRVEIQRKNDTIASLRRELDDIILRRTLKDRNNSSEIRDLTDRLSKVLKENIASELSLSKGVTKIKPKDNAIKVTHFSTDDVYTIKVGNTSFTSVFSGDITNKSSLLTIEQRNKEVLNPEIETNDEPAKNSFINTNNEESLIEEPNANVSKNKKSRHSSKEERSTKRHHDRSSRNRSELRNNEKSNSDIETKDKSTKNSSINALNEESLIKEPNVNVANDKKLRHSSKEEKSMKRHHDRSSRNRSERNKHEERHHHTKESSKSSSKSEGKRHHSSRDSKRETLSLRKEFRYYNHCIYLSVVLNKF